MKLLEVLKYFNNNSNETKEIKKITDTLPSNDIMAKEVLKDIGNNTTKVVLDSDIKNSYYVYLKDTIYISNKEKNQGIHRCCLVAHECVHSIQSKLVQKVNFIVSNIELIAFFIAIICTLVKEIYFIPYIYFAICLISIIPRCYLELDAIFNSLKLSKTYLKNKLSEGDLEKIMNIYKSQVKVLLPFSFITLFLGKIVRILIVILININF